MIFWKLGKYTSRACCGHIYTQWLGRHTVPFIARFSLHNLAMKNLHTFHLPKPPQVPYYPCMCAYGIPGYWNLFMLKLLNMRLFSLLFLYMKNIQLLCNITIRDASTDKPIFFFIFKITKCYSCVCYWYSNYYSVIFFFHSHKNTKSTI